MSTFRRNFETGVQRRGVQITHDPREFADALLIIAGTRHLRDVRAARKRGLRIVQRLDGINWVHRRRFTGPRHFVRAEYGNLLLAFIRGRVATHVLYQSEFTRSWWDLWYGSQGKPSTVVHNGVDLDEYRPEGAGSRPEEHVRLLVVEGSLGGGYDMGLDNAVQLARLLREKHGFPMELQVVGRIDGRHQDRVQARASVPILWAGTVEPRRLPEIYRSAHLFFSADLNPACPNAVIEALGCGLPVVAFDTGAMKEIVVGEAGRLVPYGGNPWRLDAPDVTSLAEAAAQILGDQRRFSLAARRHAEGALGLERMMDGYLRVLLEA